jgi:hypothetical protein
VLLKTLRIIIGFVLVCAAVPILIQGGLSRYARFGVPSHANWPMIVTGLALTAVGLTCIRPDWWRKFTKAV